MKWQARLGVAMVIFLLFGCSRNIAQSSLTPGMAKAALTRGETKQVQVLEQLGPPNIVTTGEKGEVWVYDKVSSQQSAGFLGGTAVLLWGGASSSSRSETTVMLIIYFDENDVVTDYRMSQTQF